MGFYRSSRLLSCLLYFSLAFQHKQMDDNLDSGICGNRLTADEFDFLSAPHWLFLAAILETRHRGIHGKSIMLERITARPSGRCGNMQLECSCVQLETGLEEKRRYRSVFLSFVYVAGIPPLKTVLRLIELWTFSVAGIWEDFLICY